MAVNPCPLGPKPQYELASGTPAVGYKLFFYVAGSVNTKQNTYTDSTGSVANTNPIILNSLGQPTTQIWFTAGQSYKVVYAPDTDTDPPTSPVWTIDNLVGINDVTVSQSEWVAGPAPTYVSATSFTLVGDQTSTFAKSRRLKTTNSGGTIYSTITNTAYAAVTTVTVANDSGTLDSGLSAVSYSLISSVNPTIDADMVNRKGAVVASAATTDIWSIVGNYVHISGVAAITSFGTAPYAGAERTVVFDGALTLTHNATTLVLPGGANITTAANDRAVVRADTTANMIVVSYIKASGLPPRATQPTRQVLTSGTGATYTTPINCTRINVCMVGAGGSGGTSGANGTNTTFSTLTAGGGGGALTQGGAGGAGGTAAGGDINIPGMPGQTASQNSGASVAFSGLSGANSRYGGAGQGGAVSAVGTAAATNSGSGGGSDGVAVSTNQRPSGGAGGYVEKLITSPAATYTYTVGVGGIASAGGQAGAAGIIIVDEWYN